jgi:GPI transamidase subunit PIG-U
MVAVLYLWSPLSVAACIGGSTGALESAAAAAALYGAAVGNPPLAAIGTLAAAAFSVHDLLLAVGVGFKV